MKKPAAPHNSVLCRQNIPRRSPAHEREKADNPLHLIGRNSINGRETFFGWNVCKNSGWGFNKFEIKIKKRVQSAEISGTMSIKDKLPAGVLPT